MSVEFIREVLALGDGFTETGDLWEDIWWRTDEPEYSPVTFFVNCNDQFYWACADCEKLTPENIGALKQALVDVREAQGVPFTDWPRGRDFSEGWDEWYHAGSWAVSLFCSRQRGMRPQRPYYRSMPEKLKPLFDACGPARDPKDEG